MKVKLFIIATIMVLTLTMTTNNLNAQNAATDSSNYAGIFNVSVNLTASELGKNVSITLNDAGEEVGSTLNELGRNMSGVGSEIGSDILNETEQTAKKIGIGAADVLSNISGEIKEGINDK
jgi:hypothetical protein